MYKYAIVPEYKLLHAGAAALRILELECDVLSDSVVIIRGQLLNDAKVGCNKNMQAMIYTCLTSFHTNLYIGVLLMHQEAIRRRVRSL